MNKTLDTETALAIVFGTVFMIMVFIYLATGTSVPDYLEVQICAIIVTVMAAIYGSVAGGLIPLASYLIVHLTYPRDGALTGVLFLIFIGLSTGHYASAFKIRTGEFKGISLVDFAVIEVVLAVIVWVCVQPLSGFYIEKADLRSTLNIGVMHFGIAAVTELCICLPILLLANRLFARRQEVSDAGKDFG